MSLGHSRFALALRDPLAGAAVSWVLVIVTIVSSVVSIEAAGWSLMALVYLGPTAIFLYSDKLKGFYKWLYSLSVVPVFVLLMIVNLWLVDKMFPDALNSLHSFLTVLILPVSVCSACYFLFVRLSCHRRQSA
jgi:hypothetical protein